MMQGLQEVKVGLSRGGLDTRHSTASHRDSHQGPEDLHPSTPRGQSSLPCWAPLQHFSFSNTCEYKNCPKRWNCTATCTNRDGVCSGTKKICGLKLNWETYLIVSRQDSHFRSKYRYHMFPHTSTAFSHCYYCKRLLPEMASCRSEVREECCVRDEMNPTSNMLSKSTAESGTREGCPGKLWV